MESTFWISLHVTFDGRVCFDSASEIGPNAGEVGTSDFETKQRESVVSKPKQNRWPTSLGARAAVLIEQAFFDELRRDGGHSTAREARLPRKVCSADSTGRIPHHTEQYSGVVFSHTLAGGSQGR